MDKRCQELVRAADGERQEPVERCWQREEGAAAGVAATAGARSRATT